MFVPCGYCPRLGFECPLLQQLHSQHHFFISPPSPPQPHFGVGLHQFNISALRAMALRGVLEGLFGKAAAWAPNNTGLLGLERNHFLQQSSKDQRNQPMSNQDFLFHLPTPPPPIPTQGIHVSQQVGVGLERGRQPLAPRPV